MTFDLIINSGLLPPGLVVETLSSIQSLIFHWRYIKSGKILDRLIRKHCFDAECAEYDAYAFDEPGKGMYLYWDQHLASLHEFIDSVPPPNSLKRWFQQHVLRRK